MSGEIPPLKEHVQSLLSGRMDLDEHEAQLALRALEESPELREWLRTQYRMDTLLNLALNPESADFPNRLRVASANPSTELFLQRVHSARTSRRLKRTPARLRHGLFVAMAAVLSIGFCAALTWHYSQNQSENGAVLSGEVQVNSQNVAQIPSDADFTVTGNHAAVITLGDDSRAELSPTSRASLHATQNGERDCELVTGSGSFSLNGGTRINTGVASVSGDHTQVAATWTSAKPAVTHPASGQVTDDGHVRSLKISVSSGSARILTAQQTQLLHPHETLVIDVSTRHAVTSSHRGFQGQVWSVAHQVLSWALAVGDARSQRTCLIPRDLAVTIDGVSADPSEIRKGDLIELQFAPGTTDQVVSAQVTTPVDPAPAPSH